MLRRFHEAGTPVWSLTQPWTETADRRLAGLLGAIYAWMAAEEFRRRREWVKAGLAARPQAVQAQRLPRSVGSANG